MWTAAQLRAEPAPEKAEAIHGWRFGLRAGGRRLGAPEEPAGLLGRRAGALPLRGGGLRVLVLVATGATTLTTVNSNNSLFLWL